jgi:cytoskeleton protein RodZ
VQATGIGPALRKARLLRGKSIEEASRETRIKADYLHALERERFETLLGDVYVRGCLRSYSAYLGIDADQVLTIYKGHFGAPSPAITEGQALGSGGGRKGHGLPELVRHHPSWSALAAVAVLVLAIFAGMGLLSRSRSAPAPASIGGLPGSAAAGTFKVTLAIHARASVEATVQADGERAAKFLLRPNETRTFQAATSIALQLSRGGAAELTVNGHDVGHPGRPGSPYTASYGPDSPGSPPSPNGP